jgi:DNA-binding LacI/PurR family transcriptional regulator
MVGMGNPAWAHQQRSIVAFDDERGGYDATRHLIERGHRSIAYLGVHCQGGDHGLYWSQERERGWRRAMNSTGVLCDHLAFLPPRFLSSANGLSTWHEQREMAMMAAQVMLPLLQSRVVTGVVAANDLAASALMQMLRDSSTRFALWPAIVSFDNELFDIFAAAPERSHLLTSLRLPWEEVGRAAAELLWERAHGRTQHTPLHRVVPMQLIPRFSCRADWTVQLQRLTESPRRRTGRENTRECIASEHAGV